MGYPKLGEITPEITAILLDAKRKEKEFFARQGFPDYETSDSDGKAHPAHREWAKMVGTEGPAYDSPMARKMFVLGWLKREQSFDAPSPKGEAT